MRVVVTGTRNAATGDAVFIRKAMDALHEQYKISLVGHGGASGVDDIVSAWAIENGVQIAVFNADWDEHGTAAGPIRNREMLETIKPQIVAAFPEPKARLKGSGTWDAIEAAVERGHFVRIYPLKDV